MPPAAWTVRSPAPDDYDRWRSLYAAYAAFYEQPQSDADARKVWSWIHDRRHELECLLVEGGDVGIVGLAHFRPFARPLAASTGGYLDDLFVDPKARGAGAADALLAALRGIGTERGWTLIRWITADDNHRARRKYDQVAERTAWVTYDMPLGTG